MAGLVSVYNPFAKWGRPQFCSGLPFYYSVTPEGHMSIDADVRQALEFENDTPDLTLTFNLNVDPDRRATVRYKLALRTLLNKTEGASAEDVLPME